MAAFIRFNDRLHKCLSLALVVLFASGCVGGLTPPVDQTPSINQPTPTQAVSDTTEAPPPATQPPDTTQPPNANVGETFLAWIVGLGPGSPEGPTQVDMYQLIQQATQESCRQALDPALDDEATKALYHGAAAACLAALHGKQARWAEAEGAFSSLPSRPAGCVDQATYDLLQSILEAYHDDPDAIFTREGQPVAGKPDRVRLQCPRVSNVTVTRGSGALQIDVVGSRLNQVLQISYALVDQCPQPPDFESALMLESIGDGQSLHATATDAEAAWIWVGLIAEPIDWVAAADCVSIQDAASD